VVVVVVGREFTSKPQQGAKIIESCELDNKSFRVSVVAYAEENGGFVPGAYYVFRSSRLRSDTWREIMTVRHDDPDPIPRDQIRFLNEQIGYVFMVYKYAVTTDAGENWFVWDITKEFPDWRQNRAYIKDVRIESAGSGTMTLIPVLQPHGALELHTSDYGRHWGS
jgi:hypothetical protein